MLDSRVNFNEFLIIKVKKMKKLYLILLISLPFAQQLDPIDMAIEELRTRVEAASRSSQRVFVDDFTGLN